MTVTIKQPNTKTNEPLYRENGKPLQAGDIKQGDVICFKRHEKSGQLRLVEARDGE